MLRAAYKERNPGAFASISLTGMYADGLNCPKARLSRTFADAGDLVRLENVARTNGAPHATSAIAPERPRLRLTKRPMFWFDGRKRRASLSGNGALEVVASHAAYATFMR